MAKASKLMSMREAIKKFVRDGDKIYLGGFVHATPFAAVHEIIRQKKVNLTISSLGGTIEFDQMIGAGCVTNQISSYCWNPIPKPMYCFKRAMEEGKPNKIKFEEFSFLSLSFAYFAGAMDLPFIGTKTLLGSDFITYRSHMGENKLKIIESPFNGEKVCLIPPIKHDLGILQVQRSDSSGNTQFWGINGSTKYGINSCKRVIVCAEEIVEKDVIRQNPDHTIVPEFRVDAVVEEPWGGHPTSMTGFYDRDQRFYAYYAKLSKTQEGFNRFMDEWVYGIKDRQEYLKKMGKDRMDRVSTGGWDIGGQSFGHYKIY